MSNIKNADQLKGKVALEVKIIPEKGATVSAMFIPKELSFSKKAKWSEKAAEGADKPVLEFAGAQAISLNVEFLFDRYEEKGGDVRPDVQAILDMVHVNQDTHMPPMVTLVFGTGLFPNGQSDLKGVVESADVTYTMFSADGNPVRARVKVAFKEWDGKTQLESSNSPDVAKKRVVKRGDTLQSIALSEYKEAGEWRRIADTNGIDDPLSLFPGQELLIPPIL